MATDLRKTGISVVGDIPWGTHFCHFYETKQDLLDILVPYFKAGLESKEFCLWVVSNSELLTVEEAQGAERRRVARELHDEIGQALTAIKFNLQAMQHCAEALPLVPQFNESTDIVDRALQQVRDLSLNLRPSLLDDLGLVAALRWYVDHEAQRAGLIPHFVVDLSETRLPPELETACFRIAQEALTNVMRHAQARRICVELRRRGEELHLTVRDDGIGFDVGTVLKRRASGEGLGLQGMQERALILNGKIEIKSAPLHGTEIHVWFSLAVTPAFA
jgi:signal transduction histidine kinase